MAKASDRSITIVAEPDSNSPNGYAFSLNDGKGGEANLVFDKNTVQGMKKQDYFLIEFKLDNKPGSTLVFAKDRDKVLWACPTQDALPNGCPPDGSQMDSIFYVHPTKKIQDDKLYVINTDMDHLSFRFAFNFLNESGVGPKYVKYDPGGSNQNGGVGTKEPNAFGALISVGLVSAAVAAFATYGFLR